MTKQCENCGRGWPLENGLYNPVGNYYVNYCTSCSAPVDYTGPLRGYNAVKPFDVLALPMPPMEPFNADQWLEDKQAREAEDAAWLDRQIEEMEAKKQK